MSAKPICFALVAAASVSFLSPPASAQGRPGPASWEELGCVEVGRRVDREIIRVGRREGRFRAIRLTARGNDVRINDLRVVYVNGTPDDIRVRDELREGAQTRPLDLRGRDRGIDSIEMTLQRDFQGRGRGRATVCVYGLQAFAPPRDIVGRGPGRWEQLGCVGTGVRPDHDVIEVGRREGRFRAIRLRAEGADIDVDSVKVIYGNGAPDELRVRSLLRRGQETHPLDLQGRDRVVARIELRTKRDTKGLVEDVMKGVLRGKGGIKGATICVDGLEDRPGRRG